MVVVYLAINFGYGFGFGGSFGNTVGFACELFTLDEDEVVPFVSTLVHGNDRANLSCWFKTCAADVNVSFVRRECSRVLEKRGRCF